MKVIVERCLAFSLFVICIGGAEEEGPCTLVDDYYKKNLKETLCYLRCLSNALNKLYTDGERKMLVNEEVYANASRILDDMEGKTGESTKYLSVVSSAMGDQRKKMEKLISYGNEMGDLVAKVGGLFSEVNESVRAVRKYLPDALTTANKYYASIAEITRTAWDDVKAVEAGGTAKCEERTFQRVKGLLTPCADQTCPLAKTVNESTLKTYKDGCLAVTVQNGSVRECFNLPRDNLYRSGAVKNSNDALEWKEVRDRGASFQLKVKVQEIFGPLITPFAAGQPPSMLLGMVSNITSLHSQFNKVHNNFTSLLFDIDVAGNVTTANSSI
ncbi:expression site-associated gene (ESAG) protein [Trypanosoma brucei brucei TREU927]|uniref:Expression site-associated gene (ESAG) protein n=1 Tax=Trypanosoma brucei brucei (strain 927/4 GUTat10.1) TaxID=185431 RepID=Q38G40_TRYB2|nr:expression site-associated protein [Trypanosoma brucei brucei TREU927]EAN76230.1 expression site-associated gene (ESAG) protein [Trypanosoma brucei brucei TREU927]